MRTKRCGFRMRITLEYYSGAMFTVRIIRSANAPNPSLNLFHRCRFSNPRLKPPRQTQTTPQAWAYH